MFLREIFILKQGNKGKKGIREMEGDKVAEKFRNKLIEYMKSTHKTLSKLHYLVGDIVMRNRDLFLKFYTDAFHCKISISDNLEQLQILR